MKLEDCIVILVVHPELVQKQLDKKPLEKKVQRIHEITMIHGELLLKQISGNLAVRRIATSSILSTKGNF